MGELTVSAELLAAAVLTLQVVSTAVVALVAARWTVIGDRLLQWFVGWLAAIAVAVGVPLLLGALTILSRPSVVVVHAVLLVLGVLGWRRLDDGDSRPPGRVPVIAAVAVGAAAAYAALAVLVALGIPSRDTDTREYHVTNLATWLREGSIWGLPYQSPGGVSATHPGDAELLGVWLSTPSHGDELAYVMPAAFGVLLILGSAVLARELAGGDDATRVRSAALGALASTAVLSAPIYATTQTASLSNDVVVAACVTSVLALLAAARSAGSWRLVTAAGVALGLAVGGKYTALVPGAALAVGAIWVVPRRRLWWWLVPGVACFALPWYVRNLVQTGNPLFPQALGPLQGGATPLQVIDDPVASHIIGGDGALVLDWLEFLVRRVGPVVILASAGALLALRRGPRRTERVFAAVVAVAAFVGYLFIPYSGGGPTGLPFLVVSSLRYSMTAVAVGAVCWAAVPWYRVVVGSLAGVGLWNVWQLRDVFPRDRPDVGFGDRHLVAILGVGIVVAVVARAVGGAWPRFSTGAIALAGVGVVAVFAGSAAAFHRYDRGGMPTALEHALLVTAGQDEPVAVLGVLDLRSILGPRLERPLVGVSRGGEVGEIPFADENQIRRLVLDDPRFPAAPAAFGPLLDEALARSNARFLVVGSLGQTVYPEGWVPDDRWCGVETLGPTTLLERCP